MVKWRRNESRCGITGVGTLAAGVGRGDIETVIGGVDVDGVGLESSATGES